MQQKVICLKGLSDEECVKLLDEASDRYLEASGSYKLQIGLFQTYTYPLYQLESLIFNKGPLGKLEFIEQQIPEFCDTLEDILESFEDYESNSDRMACRILKATAILDDHTVQYEPLGSEYTRSNFLDHEHYDYNKYWPEVNE